MILSHALILPVSQLQIQQLVLQWISSHGCAPFTDDAQIRSHI